MTTHLTMRALEFLRGNIIPAGGYLSKIGTPACGAPERSVDGTWCRTEDARSLARSLKVAYEWAGRDKPRTERPINLPTCEKCQVLLDAALQGCPEDFESPLVGIFAAIQWFGFYQWVINRIGFYGYPAAHMIRVLEEV